MIDQFFFVTHMYARNTIGLDILSMGLTQFLVLFRKCAMSSVFTESPNSLNNMYMK